MTTPRTFLSTLTGSFASPAAENPTVSMIEAAYTHHGLDARYINCDVGPEQLEAAVRGAVAMNWVGFNCSIPNKIAVIDYLDELAPSASVIGAVNCVVVRDGRLIGENTDGQGFLTSLKTVVDPSSASVLILGAGGAARAIAVELALAGARHLTIANRDLAKAEVLAGIVTEQTSATAAALQWDHTLAIPGDVSIVVNATSIGLFPDTGRPNIDYGTLRQELVVADVIPNPPRTAFLEQAQAAGCTTLDGRGMLVNQGVISIKLWTGLDAEPDVMRVCLDEIFG